MHRFADDSFSRQREPRLYDNSIPIGAADLQRHFELAESNLRPAEAVIFPTVSTRGSSMDVVRILCAIILPPLGVFLQVGLGLHFWLNILLTLLGYVPGIVHAVWVVLRK